MTKVDENTRYVVNNKALNIRYNDGTKESIDIHTHEELFTLLENVFYIHVNNIQDKEYLIKRIDEL